MTTQTLKWSGRRAIPTVGTRVRVYLNQLGTGTVTGHFSEEGYLGVVVKLDQPPQWLIDQGSDPDACHVFGPEIEPRA